MLREGSKIKVHLYSPFGKHEEIKTRNYNKVFAVYEKEGELGINWNTMGLQHLNDGEVFTPFRLFAPNIIFENIKTGKQYYFDTITKRIQKRKGE